MSNAPSKRFALWIACFSICALANSAHAADCVASAGGVDAPLHSAPNGAAPEVGRLHNAAPLVAIMLRWYETRTPEGTQVFVSKLAANVIQCASAPVVTLGAAGVGPFELHSIDVGTGLAIFVRGPTFSILFDAGSNDDVARGADNRVAAYLRTLSPKVKKLDHVFLSHPHRDHVELLPDIFDMVDVGNVWNSGAYNDICGYRQFLKAVASEPGVQYHTATQGSGPESVLLAKKKCYGNSEQQTTLIVRHGDRITDAPITLGPGATMSILHADGSNRPSFNENSLVVRLKLGNHSVLLMGDAEAGGRKSPAELPAATSIEGKLLACCIDELKSEILVVGHHGSKTSSRTAFLDAVGAKLFIVSSGPTRYATVTLPDAEVITELENRGDVFRTDLDDDVCATAEDKTGPDNDGKAGGCSNIVVKIPSAGLVSAEYQQPSD
jgi:beta-lactamase superfamily II metal-dependent hydrolase